MFSWKFIKITGFHEIMCFSEDFMFFAKSLPLCQHAKIAIIPMGFHSFWSQLLPKIVKKHLGMHFTVILAEIYKFYTFYCNLAKITWIPAIPSIWAPPAWKHKYPLRNIKVPGCVNPTKNK